MATLYLLGTGAALSDPHRTTTMLAVENEKGIVLVDCGGDAVQRLMQAGGDPRRVVGLIVTHEHADHVSGFPLLMEKLWLAGRRSPLDVYGIRPAIEQARRVHDSFDTSAWPGYPGARYHEVALMPGSPVMNRDGWCIVATPGKHAVPSVGLRFREEESGAVLAFSCDTAYHEPIARLAQGASILVHEATGSGPGHSSAGEAAAIAARAGVDRLLLVHLPSEEQLGEAELAEARETFPGLAKGEEGGTYSF